MPCTYLTPPPPPSVCEDPRAENVGGPMPCTYGYIDINGMGINNALIPTNAALAQAKGFTGKGVKLGLIGHVQDAELSDAWKEDISSAFGDKIAFYQDFMDVPPLTKDQRTKGLPGFKLAYIMVGSPLDEYQQIKEPFYGGIAPDARLYWGGNCNLAECQIPAMQEAANTLTEQGVRLFSISQRMEPAPIGRNPYEQTANDYAWALQDTLINDPLFVVSAGDDTWFAEAGMGAHVPKYFPQFSDHWLVGKGVYIHEGLPYTESDAPYPTAICGSIMYWCVAAPHIILHPFPASPNKSDYNQHTINTTPIITGVAALVWEAYPWMSASNVQQTVLTTATDIGEPGVDKVYGWGMVNAAKAVDGPAQFISNAEMYLDGFVADFEGTSRPFYNDISGDGWFVKQGGGTLTMTGHNTYTGGTWVEHGTLRSSGSFGSRLIVVPGARFETAGSGVTVNADVYILDDDAWNEGVPADEQTFMGPATLGIKLGAPLTVTGEMEIFEGSRLTLLPEADDYIVQSTETLITANQGLFGEFSDVTYGPGFFWEATLNYSDTALTADLTRASAQAQAMSLGAPARVIDGAGMADTLIGYTDILVQSGQTTGHEALLSATARLMSASTNEAALLSLSSLTGEIHGAARALGIRRALDGGERLADRLRSLGHRQQTGVWMQGGSGNGHVQRMGYGEAEVHHSAWGIGADTRFGDAWTLGVSAARTRSNAHLDTLGGRLTGSGQQMAVYARRDIGPRGYLSSLASHDRHTVDTQRRVLAGESLNSVTGQHTDSATLVRLETGLRFRTGLAPYLAAGTLSLRQGGFTEAGMLGLSAGADTFTTTFAELGTRFDRHIGRWTFAGTASARRMSGGAGGFNAAFTGAEAARVNVTGQPLARSSIRLGSDIGYRARNGWQISLALGADQGSGQRRNGWGEASASIGF